MVSLCVYFSLFFFFFKRKRGFDIHWLDDTHALGLFSSPIAGEWGAAAHNRKVEAEGKRRLSHRLSPVLTTPSQRSSEIQAPAHEAASALQILLRYQGQGPKLLRCDDHHQDPKVQLHHLDCFVSQFLCLRLFSSLLPRLPPAGQREASDQCSAGSQVGNRCPRGQGQRNEGAARGGEETTSGSQRYISLRERKKKSSDSLKKGLKTCWNKFKALL